MSPKKAIIILTIITLALAVIFSGFYYFNKKNNLETQNNFLPSAEDGVKSGQEIIKEKINEITARGEREGKTKDEIREEVVNTVNDYIVETKQNQTPEEKAAQETKDREREKIIEEFNDSLKNK